MLRRAKLNNLSSSLPKQSKIIQAKYFHSMSSPLPTLFKSCSTTHPYFAFKSRSTKHSFPVFKRAAKFPFIVGSVAGLASENNKDEMMQDEDEQNRKYLFNLLTHSSACEQYLNEINGLSSEEKEAVKLLTLIAIMQYITQLHDAKNGLLDEDLTKKIIRELIVIPSAEEIKKEVTHGDLKLGMLEHFSGCIMPCLMHKEGVLLRIFLEVLAENNIDALGTMKRLNLMMAREMAICVLNGSDKFKSEQKQEISDLEKKEEEITGYEPPTFRR